MKRQEPIKPFMVLDYWRILRNSGRLIGGFVVLAVAGAYIVSKVSPSYYQSSAVVLPSLADPGSGGGLSLGGSEGGKKEESGNLGALFGQASTTSDVLKSILHSRLMADSIIEQLNLKAYYGTESMTALRGRLKSETTISVNREKAFIITAESTDPKMAADIANAYVSNLDRLYRTLNVTSVTRNRLFIEKRLEAKRQQLAEAEEARKEFQIKHRTLLVTDKAQAAMKVAGGIEENILDLEIQLAGLKEYATPSHPLMNQLDAQVKALRKQSQWLQQQQQGKLGLADLDPKGLATGFFSPMPQMPGLALEYIRLAREVKIHEAVVSMLTGQYEQARIAEVKDTPTIQVLDPAIPAEFRSRPLTLHNMQLAAVIALVLGIFAALVRDYLARLSILEAGGGTSSTVSPTEALMPSILSGSHTVVCGNGTTVPSGYSEREPEPARFERG